MNKYQTIHIDIYLPENYIKTPAFLLSAEKNIEINDSSKYVPMPLI